MVALEVFNVRTHAALTTVGWGRLQS